MCSNRSVKKMGKGVNPRCSCFPVKSLSICQAHLSRLLLEVDLPAVRVEAVAEGVERQDQVETRTDKCLKWYK